MNFAKISVFGLPLVTTTRRTLFFIMNTVTALLSPQGAYFISNTLYRGGGLKRKKVYDREDLLTKSNDKDTYDSVSVLLLHI